VDGDFDGVENELSVGDMTATAICIAAQPRPTTPGELAALGLADPPPAARAQAIQRSVAVRPGTTIRGCPVLAATS